MLIVYLCIYCVYSKLFIYKLLDLHCVTQLSTNNFIVSKDQNKLKYRYIYILKITHSLEFINQYFLYLGNFILIIYVVKIFI